MDGQFGHLCVPQYEFAHNMRVMTVDSSGNGLPKIWPQNSHTNRVDMLFGKTQK